MGDACDEFTRKPDYNEVKFMVFFWRCFHKVNAYEGGHVCQHAISEESAEWCRLTLLLLVCIGSCKVNLVVFTPVVNLKSAHM